MRVHGPFLRPSCRCSVLSFLRTEAVTFRHGNIHRGSAGSSRASPSCRVGGGRTSACPLGKVAADIPEAVRAAIREDLASGAYQKAAQDAVAGDPDLAQG